MRMRKQFKRQAPRRVGRCIGVAVGCLAIWAVMLMWTGGDGPLRSAIADEAVLDEAVPDETIAGEVDAAAEITAEETAPEKPAEPEAAEKPADDKPADAKKDRKGEKPPKPAGPLGRLIRGIFGGAKPDPADPIIPQNDEDEAETPAQLTPSEQIEQDRREGIRDHIDRRAPHDRDAAKLLRRANDALQEAQASGQDTDWRNTLDLISYLLHPPQENGDAPAKGTHERSMVRQPEGGWADAADLANELLGQLPPEYLELYQANHAGRAEQLLLEARRTGDLEQIGEVARRYFHTPAGQQAVNLIGTLHADRGEFGMAALWFRRLLDNDAEITHDPRWRVKAALALHLADDPAAAELLASLDGQSVRLGSGPAQPRELIERVPRADRSNPAVDEWRMLLGNAAHNATARGGEPLLLPRWSFPLTSFEQGRESVQTLVEDLVDSGRAPIPAFFPIAVDGKVIFRTLRGVKVVDADSGRQLWETRIGLSPEQLLAGYQPGEYYQEAQFGFGGGFVAARAMVQAQTFYNGNGSADYDRLTSLLFRDGTWGVVSSDGQRLFVLEEHAVLSQYQPGNTWAFQNGQEDPYRRDFSSNKIAAYRLSDGRLDWEVGGTAMDEPFDRRLAGYYFSGTPVADGDSLLVVGEKSNEVRLFSLDAQTGRPNWSQLLAYSDTEIATDFGRRWWNAQPAVGRGVVVCPTTLGWLVAVDRTHHSILWAQRYTPPRQYESQHRHFRGQGGELLVPQTPLNQQWCPSAPVIVGRRVIYTPPEAAEAVCLDLFTGKQCWQMPKGDALYLAGVFDGRVVFVGKDFVQAVSVESGKTVWHQALPEDAGAPSGHGVAVGTTYHLPTRAGGLVSLDLTSGRITNRSYTSERTGALGNLVMYRGMLLSLGPNGMAAFEQREAIEGAIAARKKENPRDGWALLREAEIDLLNRNYDAALDRLHHLDAETLSPTDRPRYHRSLVDTLAMAARADLVDADDELAELRTIAQGPHEQRLLGRLIADAHQARGESLAAFDEYLELAAAHGPQIVPRDDDDDITVRLDFWVAARLRSLWDSLSADDRARLDSLIAARAEAAIDASDADAAAFLRLFDFHPASATVRQELARRDAAAGRIGLAELRLRRLVGTPDRQIAAESLAALGELFAEAGLPHDAAYYYRLAANRYPDVSVAGDQTAKQLWTAKRAGALPAPNPEPLRWTGRTIEAQVGGTDYSYGNEPRPLFDGPSRMPFFQQHRIEFRYQQQQLILNDATGGTPDRIVPLRMRSGAGQSQYIPSETVGHLIFLVHGDVIHAVSPVDHRTLWTQTIGETGGSARRYVHRSNNMPAMRTAEQLGNMPLLQAQQGRGALAVANREYVAVYGRRDLSVYDAASGQLRWSRDRIRNGTSVVGTEELVFISTPGQSEPEVYSALDGSRVEVEQAARLLGLTVYVSGRELVTVETGASQSLLGLSRGRVTVRAVEPVSGQERWTVRLAASTSLTLLEDGHLVALEPSGLVKLVDLESGETRELGEVSERMLRGAQELYAFADAGQVYLVINGRNRSSVHFSTGNLRYIRVHGDILAFDREEGRRVWEKKLDSGVLLVDEITHSPLLIVGNPRYVREGNIGFYMSSVSAIDKFTGKDVIENAAATNNSGYYSMTLELAQGRIELKTYNNRLRITAGPPPATAEAKPDAANAAKPAVAEDAAAG